MPRVEGGEEGEAARLEERREVLTERLSQLR